MAKMIKCKCCSKEIASNAKSCPGCGTKNKKPIYKRPWFMVIVFLVVVGAIGSIGDDDSTKTNSGAGQEITQKQDTGEKATVKEVKKEEKAEDNAPTEYKTALKKAKTYSDTMNMSKSGVYDQLTSEYGEKYTVEAAQYAIDNLQADWKENALKKAKTYQESMSMSPSAIYDQLISEYGEKFTAEEAQYSIDNLQ
ncbi:Ltp family lipoprotein [Clostridium sp.]|uniref:Ltp family lipoprotein n=1 Tax=Clostridium sp. TaxID=1506 RepID=UPI0026095C8B|nr:Ltp family lipoprotein [Clostridium sp.]